MKWQLMFGDVSREGDIREKVEAKFQSLEKYLTGVKEELRSGLVRLSKGPRWGYMVKVDLKLPGKEISVVGRGKELLTAIDRAYERVARITRKYYDKMKKKRRG